MGDFYPYIVYATGPIDNLRWRIMKAGESLPDNFGPKAAATSWDSAKEAYEWAREFKAEDDEQLASTSPTTSHGDPLCYGV